MKPACNPYSANSKTNPEPIPVHSGLPSLPSPTTMRNRFAPRRAAGAISCESTICPVLCTRVLLKAWANTAANTAVSILHISKLRLKNFQNYVQGHKTSKTHCGSSLCILSTSKFWACSDITPCFCTRCQTLVLSFWQETASRGKLAAHGNSSHDIDSAIRAAALIYLMPRPFIKDVWEKSSWRKNTKQLATGQKNNVGDLMTIFKKFLKYFNSFLRDRDRTRAG